MVSVKTNIPTSSEFQEVDVDSWIQTISENHTDHAQDVIKQACNLAKDAHRGQIRASGEIYFHHVLSVADILAELGMDYETLAAAVLHDVVEDTKVTLLDIERNFGNEIAHMVDGVTKMRRIHEYQELVEVDSKHQSHAENLRKLLLAMVEDVRVVLIKLADRLHNMRTLQYLSREKQKRIAQETADIYAPLANRLGIWQIKWELEDLAFRYLQPSTYKKIAKLLDERRIDREEYIKEFIDTLQAELKKNNIDATVNGRPKHIYSIWRKMKRKKVDFHQIFDVRAVRVLVDDLTSCYAALGVVHTLWKHIHGEFDDYIATPKDNMYQSLHTAIIGPKGRTVEIQIRTSDMHSHAELGVAAHWLYKEGTKQELDYERRIAWMRQLLEWKDETPDANDFIDRFKAEVYEERVYVLTPKGAIMDLPQGATVLDFAFYLHTDVGLRCRGAKINNKIVTLVHVLKSGEIVEILKSRHGFPSRDWLSPHLGYLNTPRARAKLRIWFKKQDYDLNVSEGRTSIERELHRLGVSNVSYELLAGRFKIKKVSDFLAAVGSGDITTVQIAGNVEALTAPKESIETFKPQIRPQKEECTTGEIKVLGVGDLMTSFAGCCKPVPKDPIIGYITRGRGVTIHRVDCPNLINMDDDECERFIEVEWSDDGGKKYPVDIVIRAYDRQGLLKDITALLNNEKINVLSINTNTNPKNHIADLKLILEISDITQLSRILEKIGQMPNIIDATRNG